MSAQAHREWMEFAGYLKPENAEVLRRLWPTCPCGAALTPDFDKEPGSFTCPFEEMHLWDAERESA